MPLSCTSEWMSIKVIWKIAFIPYLDEEKGQ